MPQQESLQIQMSKKFADALEKLADNSALRGRMGAAAEEFTLANFGVNRLVLDHEVL